MGLDQPHFVASEYENLKQKVSSARARQRHSENQRNAESEELQQKCETLQFQLQQQKQTHEAEIEALKKVTITANERTSRMRDKMEKDKKSWQTKLDHALTRCENLQEQQKLTLKDLEAEHQAEMEALRSQARRESARGVAQLEDELRQCVVEADERARDLEAEHSQKTAHLLAHHERSHAEAKAETATWQKHCQEASSLCEDLRSQLHEAKLREIAASAREQEQASVCQDQLTAKDERLRHGEREIKHLVLKIQQMEEEHSQAVRHLTQASQEAVAQLQAQQDLEIDSLRARVSATLEKKDKAILELRKQLAQSQASLVATEKALAYQNTELQYL